MLKIQNQGVKHLDVPELRPVENEAISRGPARFVQTAFGDAMPAWVKHPVMREWRGSKRVCDVLDQVNRLYHACAQSQPGAFNPFSDPLWASTAAVMREVGLPLYNNNINLPEEIDESWTFHFKELERFAVISKAGRVGNSDASGYVCNRYEAILYGIRAIQQELRKQVPGHQPLLLASRFDPVILQYAAQLLGIDHVQLAPDWNGASEVLETAALLGDDDSRPIIFAATLSNDAGQSDDFEAVRQLAMTRDVFVHIDVARTFDYLTTLSDSARRDLGLPKLVLSHPKAGVCSQRPDFIYAASIVAGGMNHTQQHLTVAIKPRMLGDCVGRRIEYTHGHDSTISGSRDGLGPLLIGLQEQRFDHQRRQEIFQGCVRNRAHIALGLASLGAQVSCPPESLDLIIQPPINLLQPESLLMASRLSKLGFIQLGNESSGGPSVGAWLGTVQPSVTTSHVHMLIEALGGPCGRGPSLLRELATPPASAQQYPLPSASHAYLSQKMLNWRKQLADSAGYPFNQATYSALGSVAAHFLDLSIPNEWVQAKAASILKARKVSFGISEIDTDLLSQFHAGFTTGSSMGNQIGIHAALAYAPDNFIYCSASSHYSVSKALGDSDVLTRRWAKQSHSSDGGHIVSPRPQFAIIAVDAAGRMIPSELVRQVAEDRADCGTSGRRYGVTLVINVGTTFVGGVDDIVALRAALRDDLGQEVGYIHADGALDFGFGPSQAELVCLGPPNGPTVRGDGVPVVQGITVSHHKVYGMMVSGEVVYYDPSHTALPSLATSVDPRAVFEAWLFQQIYSDDDLATLHQYCVENANALRSKLSAAGIFVLRNQTSLIVVLERPAPWVLVDFHLRAEGDCVHYITMPHITSQAIDRFTRAVISLDECYNAAFQSARLAFSTALGGTNHLVRIRPHSSHFAAVEAFVKSPETVLSCGDAGNTASPSVLAFEASSRELRSSLSVAILDVAHGPVVVLLARGNSKKEISMSQMLLHRSVVPMGKQIWSIAEGMFEEISSLVL